MGSCIPKQFLPLNGLPVLMRTIKRFREYDSNLKMILVLPKNQQEYWADLCKDYHFTTAHVVADGGETRFQSVKNGLSLVPDDADGVIGVHDGVRPFASIEVIRRCFDMAKEAKAVVPVAPIVETVRLLEPEGGSHTDTSDLRYRPAQGGLCPGVPAGVYRRCLGGGSLWAAGHSRGRQSREHQDYHPLRPQDCPCVGLGVIGHI